MGKLRVKISMVPAPRQFSDYVAGFVAKVLRTQRVMLVVERNQPVSALKDEVENANKDRILRGLNNTLDESHDNIVASVAGFTLVSLAVGGFDVMEDQILSDVFPADLQVVATAAFDLDLRFKSTFRVSLSFPEYPELLDKTLKVPTNTSVVLTLTNDNAHRIAVKDLVGRLVEKLPGKDKYQAAMKRSKVVALTWEGQNYALDSSVRLVSGLLQPLPPRSNWDANGTGITVNASLDIKWCKVHVPSSPFQKLGGPFQKLGSGCPQSWCNRNMMFTNGRLEWHSKSGKIKREIVTLTGTSSMVASLDSQSVLSCLASKKDSAQLKEVTIVKVSTGQAKRLRGSIASIDALVAALENKAALTNGQ